MPSPEYLYLVSFVVTVENGGQMFDAITVQRPKAFTSAEDIASTEIAIFQEFDGRVDANGNKLYTIPFSIRILSWQKFEEQSLIQLNRSLN